MPFKSAAIIYATTLVILTLLVVGTFTSTSGGSLALAAPITPVTDGSSIVGALIQARTPTPVIEDKIVAAEKRIEEEEATPVSAKEDATANTVEDESGAAVELESDSIGDDGKGTIGCTRHGIHRTCLPPVTHKTNPCGTTYYLRTCKKKPTKGKPNKPHGDSGPPAPESATFAQLARAVSGLEVVKDE